MSDKAGCVAPLTFCYILGGSCSQNLTAITTAFGTYVDNPVGLFYNVEVMLDDDYRVAAVNKLLKQFSETCRLMKSVSGGGPRGALGNMGRMMRR